MEEVGVYYINQLTVTGEPGNPQTISYINLTDYITGNSLPAFFSQAPIIEVAAVFFDGGIYLPSAPGTSSFQIAKTSITGDLDAAAICNLVIKDVAYSYNFNSMLYYLGVLLEDRNEAEFTVNIKSWMLNEAQDLLIDLIGRDYIHVLPELDVELTELSLDSDGAYDINDLSYELYDGIIGGIRYVKINGGYYCDLISYEEYRFYTDNNKSFMTTDPKYYIIGDKIYVQPYTSGETKIDLLITRQPPKMVQSSVDCIFREKIRNIIVGLACKNFVDKTKSARRAFDSAIAEIEKLKTIHKPTDTNIKNVVDQQIRGVPEVKFRIYQPVS